MALDEALLETGPRRRQPVLRFYGWTAPAASFGYFQKYQEVERLTPLRPLVRRPTGGGIVPHDRDWTYSLSFPTEHEWYQLSARESYHRVHSWLQAAFMRLEIQTEVAPVAAKSLVGQCFVGHETSDLLWGGRKIAGAAQRRRRDGLLIQGSVQPPPTPFIPREVWEKAMLEAAGAWGVRWQKYEDDVHAFARAAELVRTRYSLALYHQRR